MIKRFFSKADTTSSDQLIKTVKVTSRLFTDDVESDFIDSVFVKEFDADDTVPMDIEQLFKK
jgi:hypothetical protein